MSSHRRQARRPLARAANPVRAGFVVLCLALLGPTAMAFEDRSIDGIPSDAIEHAWPLTDFDRSSVSFQELRWGGVPKDGIRSIDAPVFVAAAEAEAWLAAREPVIGLLVAGEARAYPLGILMRHEIVNDIVVGIPLAITYCPLCNSALVFDRRLDGQTLEFGVSGFLRHSDLVMYDRQTESWWQQFTGEAILGSLTGARLKALPARLESFARFRERAPEGRVLSPPLASRYDGTNPYVGYDSRERPYDFYKGPLPAEVPPLSRVVRVGQEAWSLALLQERQRIEAGDLVISWEPGQASAVDRAAIADGAEVGNVLVQRRTSRGLEDVVYTLDFAFAFRAFFPDGILHVR